MTLATTLYLAILCVGVCAAEGGPPLACNLKAIAAADRPRYTELIQRLRAAVMSQNEVDDGYAYGLDAGAMTLPDVAEWITMERLCCPFLTFQLEVMSSGESRLTLRGPEGVKGILREEFPAR